MHSSVVLSSVSFFALNFRAWLTETSSTSISLDHQVQEHVTSRCCHERYGSPMDVLYLMVCLVHLWFAVGIQLPSRKR